MNDTSLDIARRLNDAPRMFWWEIDVALIFLGSMLAGMLLGLLVSGAALGVLLAWAFGTRPLRCTCCTGTCRKALWV